MITVKNEWRRRRENIIWEEKTEMFLYTKLLLELEKILEERGCRGDISVYGWKIRSESRKCDCADAFRGDRTEPLGEFQRGEAFHSFIFISSSQHIRMEMSQSPVMTVVINDTISANRFSVNINTCLRAASSRFHPDLLAFLTHFVFSATRYRRGLSVWHYGHVALKNREHKHQQTHQPYDWWAASSGCCYVTLFSITSVGGACIQGGQWDYLA